MIEISEETARLALSALDRQNGEDAYDNFLSAAEEIRVALIKKAEPWSPKWVEANAESLKKYFARNDDKF